MHYLNGFAAAVATSIVLGGPSLAQEITERLGAASAESGERVFRQCKACHTVEKGGANRTGPNLYGIIGREIGSVEGYRYSSAMANMAGSWTVDLLDAFLANPRETVSGTRMSYRGLSEPSQRADMIAFLNANSDAPLEFETAAGANTVAIEEDFGQLVLAEGVEETYYACTACHSEMIVVQQGKTRDSWDKLFDWMIEEQGMSELEPDERNKILDYLAEHYNTDRPNFPSR